MSSSEATGDHPGTARGERILERLSARFDDQVSRSGGNDPMADLFDARYPAGARLLAPSGDSNRWRVRTGSTGRGWRTVESWPQVAAAARQAEAGGFAFVSLADPVRGAAGIHVGSDGTTLWITWVRPHAGLDFRPFDDHRTDDFPPPSEVAAIDYCSDVRTNS